jgi:anaerobic magnesium-protoporphyrin IX monomethyl ester cyclase
MQNMKVLFATAACYRESMNDSNIGPFQGMFLLPQILTDYGCQVDVIFDLDVKLKTEPAEIVTQALNADLICLSAMSYSWPYVKKFAELIGQAKTHPPIVAGGIHPTLVPEYIMRTTPINVVVVGEGERAITELADYFRGQGSLEDIKGIYYRINGQVHSTPKRELLTSEELGELPIIKWDNRPVTIRYLSVQTSRGCLMDCAFCAVPFHRSWRPFPVKSILDSIEACMSKMQGLKVIGFADDCFTTDRQFATEVLKTVTERYPQVRICLEARVRDLLKPGFLEMMAETNIQQVQIGVECGYNEGLRKISKGLKIEEVEELGRRVKALGIERAFFYSYILGFPWETMTEMKATIDFAFSIADRFGGMLQIVWWSTMPGNRLFKQLQDSYGVDNSTFDRMDWFQNRDVFFLTHPWIREKDVHDIRDYTQALSSNCKKDVVTRGTALFLPWIEGK